MPIEVTKEGQKHLEWFVKSFILKPWQERWLFLMTRNWDRFHEELHSIENYFNKKCKRIELNGTEAFEKTVKYKQLRVGYYYSSCEFAKIRNPSDFNLTYGDDDLLICPAADVAFFFHHEGWVYICNI